MYNPIHSDMHNRAAALAVTTVCEMELPPTIHGITWPNRKGNRFFVLINSTIPEAARCAALEHELAHIRLGHFTDTRDLRVLEEEANELAAAEIAGKEAAQCG